MKFWTVNELRKQTVVLNGEKKFLWDQYYKTDFAVTQLQ